MEQTSLELKVKMQSVSDDDVRKRLLEQTRFELAVKDVFRLYSKTQKHTGGGVGGRRDCHKGRRLKRFINTDEIICKQLSCSFVLFMCKTGPERH